MLRAYYNILVYLNQGGTSQILPHILALVRAGADPNPEDKGQTLLQQVEKDFSELEHGELAVLLSTLKFCESKRKLTSNYIYRKLLDAYWRPGGPGVLPRQARL